jgi:flavin-binding protein dodecin
MAIMKSEEILAESTVSFEDAIQTAVSRFSKTVRGLASCNINNMSTTIRNGKIDKYRVNMQMTFEIEAPARPKAAAAAPAETAPDATADDAAAKPKKKKKKK